MSNPNKYEVTGATVIQDETGKTVPSKTGVKVGAKEDILTIGPVGEFLFNREGRRASKEGRPLGRMDRNKAVGEFKRRKDEIINVPSKIFGVKEAQGPEMD